MGRSRWFGNSGTMNGNRGVDVRLFVDLGF